MKSVASFKHEGPFSQEMTVSASEAWLPGSLASGQKRLRALGGSLDTDWAQLKSTVDVDPPR